MTASRRPGWMAAAAIVLALAVAGAAEGAESRADAVDAAISELDDMERAVRDGDFLVSTVVDGKPVFTVISRQSLENQITLWLMTGEGDAQDARSLVRTLRNASGKNLRSLRRARDNLPPDRAAALRRRQEIDELWDRIDALPSSEPSRNVRVPLPPAPHEPGFTISDGPTYPRDRPSRGGSYGASSGRSSPGAAADDAGRGGRRADAYRSDRGYGLSDGPGEPRDRSQRNRSGASPYGSSSGGSSAGSAATRAEDAGGRRARRDRAEGGFDLSDGPTYPRGQRPRRDRAGAGASYGSPAARPARGDRGSDARAPGRDRRLSGAAGYPPAAAAPADERRPKKRRDRPN